MKSLLISLLLVLGVFPFGAHAEQTPTFDSAYALYLKVAKDGDKSSLTAANRQFQALVDQNRADPVALFYLGNTNTLKAKYTWKVWAKVSLLERGLQQMDKAIALLKPEHANQRVGGMPVDLKLKASAGVAFTKVPKFTNRFDQGVLLINEVLNDERMASVQPQRKSYIYFHAAKAALAEKQTDGAKQLFQQVVQMDPDSSYGKESQEGLDQL